MRLYPIYLAFSLLVGLSLILPLAARASQLFQAPPQNLPSPSHTLEPARQHRISPFGMNTYFTGLERIGRDGEAGVAELISRGRLIGAAWAREELSWGNLERTGKGRWDWNLFDRRLLATAAGGYQMIGMLLTTPAWARVADCRQRMIQFAAAGVYAEDYWCPPANPQDFADYVYAVVERYDGDGIADAPGSPRVAAWQIGNEPNAWETWPGTPAEYGAILVAGYAAAKAADPTALVATGGVYVFDGSWNSGSGHRDGLSFLNDVFDADPAAWHSFDALAIHPFMPTVGPDEPGVYGLVTLWGRLVQTRTWLDQQTALRGGPPRPIWISEIGWSTCTAADVGCRLGGAGNPAWQIHLGSRAIETDPPAKLRLTEAARAGPAAPLLRPCHDQASCSLLPALEDHSEDGLAPAFLIGTSEQQQADYLVRSYGIALALGIEHISWFQLEDKFDGAAGNFWQQAAILRTAAEGYALKPAAVAYANLTNQLREAQFSGFGSLQSYRYEPHVLAQAGRFHLRFTANDGSQVDMLWRNQGNELLELALVPGMTISLVGRDGQRLPYERLGDTLRFTVGESPLYLRQAPPPLLSLSHEAVTGFAQTNGASRRVSLLLRNAGSGTLSWSVTSDARWARVSPTTGVGRTGDLWVTLDPQGLAPGNYQANLHISSNGGERNVPIRFQVVERVWDQWIPIVGR